jgi:hypothetical protein
MSVGSMKERLEKAVGVIQRSMTTTNRTPEQIETTNHPEPAILLPCHL